MHLCLLRLSSAAHLTLFPLQAPLSGSNSMTLSCLWCASGLITMAVSTEKKAFIPGMVTIHPRIRVMGYA